MIKYVALLRGINVGGKNMIKMETLREIFSSLGLANVKTYINSGNVVFETAKTDDAMLTNKICAAIEKELGLKISVMIRPHAEVAEVIKNNPFAGQFENDKDMYVFFLANEMSDENTQLLLAKNSNAEMIAVNGRTIYYLLRISIIDSVLGKGFVDKKLKVPATARNWRTVKKLGEM